MDISGDEFIFASINPITGEKHYMHLIDIVDSVSRGVYNNVNIKWPEYVLTNKQYEKYAFLIHCIAIRRKEIHRQKQQQEENEIIREILQFADDDLEIDFEALGW